MSERGEGGREGGGENERERERERAKANRSIVVSGTKCSNSFSNQNSSLTQCVRLYMSHSIMNWETLAHCLASSAPLTCLRIYTETTETSILLLYQWPPSIIIHY